MANETIIFRMQLEGDEVIIRSQKELSDVLRKSRQTLKGFTDEGSEGYKKLQIDVATLEAIQREYRDEANKTRADVISGNRSQEGSYNQLKAQLESLKIQYRQLGTEARQSTEGKELIANLQRVKQEFDGLRDTAGEGLFNNFNRALSGASEAISAGLLGDIGALAAALGASGPLAAAFEFLGRGLELIDEMGARIRQVRGQLEQLVDAAPEELDAVTARLLALGETFGVEDNELLLAANALEAQLTGDLSEAVDLIETGLLAGANANGEFLDSLREYPAFFREARLTGEQFISVISQGVDQGVFSDKAPDLIKEFNVSMRELTKSTEDALVAIGLTSTQVTKTIEEEGIGAAFTLVQKQLQGFADDSPAVGKALADIFRGPGEDAGIQFVKTLDLSQKTLGELVDATNPLVELQQRQLAVNQELAAAQLELTGTTQPFIEELRIFQKDVLAAVIRGLVTFIGVLGQGPKFIKENKEELLILAGAVAFYNRGIIASTLATLKDNAVKVISTARTVTLAGAWTALNAVMRANLIGIIVTALTAVSIALVAAYKRSEEFRAVIAGLGAIASEFFNIVKEALGAFLNAFDQVRQGNIGEALKSFGQAIVRGNPISLAITQGGRLGDAYTDAYNKSLASNKADTESALSEGIVDPMEEAGKKVGDAAGKAGEDAGDELTKGFDKALRRNTFNTEPAVNGIKALQAEIQKLTENVNNSDLTDTELRKALEEIVGKEQELEILQRRVQQVKQELEGGIPFPKIEKIVLKDEDINVEDELRQALDLELENLDATRLEELNNLAQRNLDYEAYQEARNEINQRYELERLETEKLLAVEGSREYLSILDQQHIAELQAEQSQSQKIEAERQKRIKQVQQYVTSALSLFNDLANAQIAIEQDALQTEAAAQQQALDEEKERRLENVASGSEEAQQINEEFEQRKIQLERATAEKQKELRVKQQKINIALAVGNALATVQPFIPAALIAAGLAAAKGAIELAVIQRQSFAGGGPTGRGYLAPDSSGHRPVGIVHANEYVVPAKVYQHPSAQPAIRKLERMRLAMGYPYQAGATGFRGFQTGGATTGGTTGATVVDVSQDINVEISEESIALIAAQVGAATERGTRAGSVEGLSEGERLRERRQALEERTNI